MSNHKPTKHAAGKGDKSRVRNSRRYRSNYDKIKWGKKRSCNGGAAPVCSLRHDL